MIACAVGPVNDWPEACDAMTAEWRNCRNDPVEEAAAPVEEGPSPKVIEGPIAGSGPRRRTTELCSVALSCLQGREFGMKRIGSILLLRPLNRFGSEKRGHRCRDCCGGQTVDSRDADESH